MLVQNICILRYLSNFVLKNHELFQFYSTIHCLLSEILEAGNFDTVRSCMQRNFSTEQSVNDGIFPMQLHIKIILHAVYL